MRIAFVVSDISYPPTEGLHQQSLLLASNLKRLGHEVDLLGFCRAPSSLDTVGLNAELGLTFSSHPRAYSGSSLLQACRQILGLSSAVRSSHVIRHLTQSRYDIVHLDGTLACSLSLSLRNVPRVLSWVDPGSRRYGRLSKADASLTGKASKIAASLIYRWLETALRSPKTPWHFVSAEDAAFIAATHNGQPTWVIPVMIPPDLTLPAVKARPAGKRLRVTIFCDLRQEHMRAGLTDFAREVLSKSQVAKGVDFVILGRVAADDAIAAAFAGLSHRFIEWADDYLLELHGSDLVVLPDSAGTGLKNRAIQSLAAGVSVLGTRIAFEGIPVVDGKHCAIAGSFPELLERFNALCASETLRSNHAESGRELVLAQFGPASITNSWVEHYQALCAPPTA